MDRRCSPMMPHLAAGSLRVRTIARGVVFAAVLSAFFGVSRPQAFGQADFVPDNGPKRAVFPEFERTYRWLDEGSKLKDDQVHSLAKQLNLDADADSQNPAKPEDWFHYLGRQRAASNPAILVPTARKLILRHPKLPETFIFSTDTFADSPEDIYLPIREAWLAAAKKSPKDPIILGHTGGFLLARFPAEEPLTKLAFRILMEAHKQQPQESRWCLLLGEGYHNQLTQAAVGRDADPVRFKQLGEDSLKYLELAVKLTPKELQDALRVSQTHRKHALARAAFAAGRDDIAKSYAGELIKEIQEITEDWNYGNALHDAHTILGHVALRAGDLTTALAELDASVEVKRSPQLESVGPSFTLAQAILNHEPADSLPSKAKEEQRKQQVKAVRKYLEKSQGYWLPAKRKLQRWIDALESGKTPPWEITVFP